MAFTNINSPIQAEGTGDRRALGLKLYSGEVLKAFDRHNIAMNYVKTRSISGGTSTSFIVTGQASDANVNVHTPGADVDTNILKSNERVITVTDRYYYSHFVDALEDKLSQYEVRSELAKQAAEALATKIDKEIFATMGGSVAVAGVADQKAAKLVVDADIAGGATAEAKGNALVESLFEMNTLFDQDDLPVSGRVFVTTPRNYYNIVQATKIIDKDFTTNNGGLDTGKVQMVAGTPVIVTNNLPATVNDGTADHDVQGYFFTPGVMGVVKAMDITSEANYIPEKLGDLLTSYYALGMGVLNPGEFGLVASS